MSNPWINRLGILVLLLAVYTAGRVDGREQATASFRNHPACHQEVKP
jgi:hypothetical protein